MYGQVPRGIADPVMQVRFLPRGQDDLKKWAGEIFTPLDFAVSKIFWGLVGTLCT